jgi:UDP-N-acetylglucosamine/UDP-N-acetylgalactosamine diphosphorylase
VIPNPTGVFIDDDVDVDRISSDVVIYPGSKLFGKETYIADGVRIGFEAPATIENCYVGPGVSLKGGFFSGSVFLAGASCGSGSHVREGTIFEEQAGIAHTVGLKQTILFPFVTLGSLINFCDCLMAGGSSRKNHSEVGSSYIHFNYTPNQDKATPSIMGDVPRGVMLNQSPIFLGGQGGLVGPCILSYGTVVAAGTICRNDQLKEGHLVFGGTTRQGTMPYKAGGFLNLKRIISHNINYMGNLAALRQWYAHVRTRFIGPQMPRPLLEGLQVVLDKAINERVRQLDRLLQNMGEAAADKNGIQQEFCIHWPQMKAVFKQMLEYPGESESIDCFLAIIDEYIHKGQNIYLDTIQGLTAEETAVGVEWLDSIVNKTKREVMGLLPSMNSFANNLNDQD